MKLILSTLTLLFAINAGAVDWGQKIPGSNYTLRDLQIQRNLMDNSNRATQRAAQKNPHLTGQGVDFTGSVEMTPGADPTQNSYKVYVRGCGKVELTKKSEDEMKNIKNGTAVRLKFIGGRSCTVSDWSKL